jgi:hypothetical protein
MIAGITGIVGMIICGLSGIRILHQVEISPVSLPLFSVDGRDSRNILGYHGFCARAREDLVILPR